MNRMMKPLLLTAFAAALAGAALAADAHALMESSEHIGKIVLDWTAAA